MDVLVGTLVGLIRAWVVTLVDGGDLLSPGIGWSLGPHGCSAAAVTEACHGARLRGHGRHPLLNAILRELLQWLRIMEL